MAEEQKKHDYSNDHEFCVVFRNQAFEKLKKMAQLLNIPEDKMGDVLVKGLHIIDMAGGGKIWIEREKDCMEIDVKKL